MTCVLHIGDRAYSSWSLRGWLMFDAFGLPVSIRDVPLYDERKAEAVRTLAPGRLVPVLDLPDGTRVPDTMAIAETLAERQPDAGLWPDDPSDRAVARWLAAEMHSGFNALRSACPMNLRLRYTSFVPDDAILADLQRLETVWSCGFDRSGGPWLLGRYSLADVFYAPIAARISGYGLPVGDDAAAYVARHLAHPSFRKWHAASTEGPEAYALDLPFDAWLPSP